MPPIESNGHSSAFNEAIREMLADMPEGFREKTSFGKGLLLEEPPKYKYHVAKQGETLYRICLMYGVSQEQFRKWNNLAARETNIVVGKKYIVGILKDENEIKDKSKDKSNDKQVGQLSKSKKYTKATSFKQLIDLVRDFEGYLLKGGMREIFERVKTIRGCFYGTEWSFDYAGPDDKGHEQSSARNIGFNLMTNPNYGGGLQFGYSPPTDPRSKVPADLFKGLRASPEVKDSSGKMVDFGHIVIGVEARFHDKPRKEEFKTYVDSYGGTGLECVTFLGDLGGGAGMLAYQRATKSSTIRAKKLVFDSANDYGATINIEGDIGSYLVGSYWNSSHGVGSGYPSKVWLKDSDYFADALEQYLLSKTYYTRVNETENREKSPQNYNLWKERYALIVQSLGMKISGGRIDNVDSEIDKWKRKINTFGEKYITNRLKDKSTEITDKQKELMYKHLEAASKEVAIIFVKTLDENIGNTSLFKPSSKLDLMPTKI